MSIEPKGEIIGTVNITVVAGNDIKVKSIVSKPSVYAVFEIGNKKLKTTEKYGKNPKWNEVFQFEVSENSILRANVYNGKNNELIGGFEFLLNEIIYIEQKSLKMKIYNDKKQEKGELHLIFNVSKKNVHNNNYYPGSSKGTDYIKENDEEEDILPRMDGVKDSNGSYPYPSNLNDGFAGQSEKVVMDQNQVYNIVSESNNLKQNVLPIHKKNMTKMKVYNGRPVKMVSQNSNRRSRSLSPMAYDINGELYRNSSTSPSKSPVHRVPSTKNHLYHFKSSESINLKQNNSIASKHNSSGNMIKQIPLPEVDNLTSSQPVFNGYLNNNSQSDLDDMDVYSSSLPTPNSNYLSSSPGKLNNNYFYNSKIPYSINNSARSPGIPKYSKNSPSPNSPSTNFNPSQSPIRSEGVSSIYSNASNSSHSKSPSLVIKTPSFSSSSSKNININSPSNSYTTPRTYSSLSRTPVPSTSPSKIGNSSGYGTSYIPKPVQNGRRQSYLKTYASMDRNTGSGRERSNSNNNNNINHKRSVSLTEESSEMKDTLPSSEYITNSNMNESHTEEVIKRNGSGRVIRVKRISLLKKGKPTGDYSKNKSSSAFLYGTKSTSATRAMTNSPLDKKEEKEVMEIEVNGRNKHPYKVRSISNDSRLYKGHYNNNSITSLDDSFEEQFKGESVESNRVNNTLINSSYSSSTEILIIDSSNDISDIRSSRGANGSFVVDKILTPHLRSRSSLIGRSASVDSNITDKNPENSNSFDKNSEWEVNVHEVLENVEGEEEERGRQFSRQPSSANDSRGRVVHRRQEIPEERREEEGKEVEGEGEEIFRRPAKAKGRLRDIESIENPPRYYSLYDSKKNGRLKTDLDEKKSHIKDNGEALPKSFYRKLSLSRNVSLKGKHIRSASQPAARPKNINAFDYDHINKTKTNINTNANTNANSNANANNTNTDINNNTNIDDNDNVNVELNKPNNNIQKVVSNHESIPEDYPRLDKNQGGSIGIQEENTPTMKYTPRRTSLSLKTHQQLLHNKEMKPVKVISPNTPVPLNARLPKDNEVESDLLHTMGSPYSGSGQIDSPREIDLIQKELNKISISLKNKKRTRNESNSSMKSEKSGDTLDGTTIVSDVSSMVSPPPIKDTPNSAHSSPKLQISPKLPLRDAPSSAHTSPRLPLSPKSLLRDTPSSTYTSPRLPISPKSPLRDVPGSAHSSPKSLLRDNTGSTQSSPKLQINPKSPLKGNLNSPSVNIESPPAYLSMSLVTPMLASSLSPSANEKMSQDKFLISPDESEMDNIINTSIMEESTDNYFSDESSSLSHSDKKDKKLWKDKYLRYIKKNSIQGKGKSKLDQCISETNSDSVSEGTEANNEINTDESIPRNGKNESSNSEIVNTSSAFSSSLSESISMKGIRSNEENSSDLDTAILAHTPNINTEKIKDDKEEEVEEMEESNANIPPFANRSYYGEESFNISLSTIQQVDDDLLNTPKILPDSSYAIMNMTNQDILSKTNLSSISLNASTDNLLSPNLGGGNRHLKNKSSVERKKIIDNNFNILSQQIQKIRDEASLDESSSYERDQEEMTPQIREQKSTSTPRSIQDQQNQDEEDDVSDDELIDPPRFDSKVDMDKTIESFNQKIATSAAYSHLFRRPDATNNSGKYNVKDNTSSATRTSSRRRDDSLGDRINMMNGRNIVVVKPTAVTSPLNKNISNNNDNSNNINNNSPVTIPRIDITSSTPTLRYDNGNSNGNGNVNGKDVYHLNEYLTQEAGIALTPKEIDALSITSNYSTSFEGTDITDYPTNSLDEEEIHEDTITRSHQSEKEIEDDNMMTPTLHQANYRSSTLYENSIQIPNTSVIKAEIYNISFDEEEDSESDEEDHQQPPRTLSLRYNQKDLLSSGSSSGLGSGQNRGRLAYGNGRTRIRSNSLSSIESSARSIRSNKSNGHHGNWDEEDHKSLASSKSSDVVVDSRRLTFGMDTSEQLFPKIKRSNSLSSISTASSYTFNLISKDNEKYKQVHRLPPVGGQRYSPVIDNSQRVSPVRQMINNNTNETMENVEFRNRFGEKVPYPSGLMANTFYNSSSIPTMKQRNFNNNYIKYPPNQDQGYFSSLNRNNIFLNSSMENRGPELNYLSPPNAMGMNIPINPNNGGNSNGNIMNQNQNPTLVKPQKSHKRFGHFKKSSISNLPVSTYHPLTHHGIKGNEGFITEEAARNQIRNANIINGTEEPISNAKMLKSKNSRIPFLSHKRNNSSLSHDSNSTVNNMNVLSNIKLEMHPIVNQL